MAVAVVYPDPPSVTVIAVSLPSVTVAVAVAPEPSPLIVIVGDEVYKPPASSMVIDVILPKSLLTAKYLFCHLWSWLLLPPPT